MPDLGNGRTKEVLLTTDELLINRAEAEVRLGDYEAALRDLNAWTESTCVSLSLSVLSPRPNSRLIMISSPMRTRRLCRLRSTSRGHTSPSTTARRSPKGRAPRSSCSTYYNARRVLSLHEGLRWQDIKRFGIDIYRWKKIDAGADTFEVPADGVLLGSDLRHAIALPQQAITGQIQQNPR